MVYKLLTEVTRPAIGLHPGANANAWRPGLPTQALVLLSLMVFAGSPNGVKGALRDDLVHPKRNAPAAEARHQPAETVCGRVERAVRVNRSAAAEVLTRALAVTDRNPVNYTGQVFRAALCGLGPEASADEVGRLVFAAVKARPAAVLEVVRVAISGTPRTHHRGVVSAAVAGVPDPTIRVIFQPVKVMRTGLDADLDCPCGAEDFSGRKLAQGKRGRYSGANAAGYMSASGQGYSLAESILEAALEAGSNENLADLSAGIDNVLENRRNSQGDLAAGSDSWAEAAGGFGNGINGGQSLNGGFGGLGTSLSLGAAPPAFSGLRPAPTPPPVSP